MNKQLELVKEFQEAFKQPVLSKEDEIPVDRRKLRLALLFEELSELAEAYGLEGSFNELLMFKLKGNGLVTILDTSEDSKLPPIDTGILNKKEVLDATADLQYILSGTVIENGQQEVFDPAFEDVHKSNMSKLCKDTGEVLGTLDKYTKEGIEVYSEPTAGPYYGIFRKSDKKILKNINYKPVDLEKYV